MAGQGSGGNVIAAICNFFIPGLGHLVQGRILGALFYFVAVGVCYALAATVVLAIVFWPTLFSCILIFQATQIWLLVLVE